MRRVRASFLLRLVVLLCSAALFYAAVWLIDSVGWTVAAVSFIVAFWFIGLEGGVLPFLIERSAVERARASDAPVKSIWFVDVDEKDRRVREQAAEDSADNPTVR